MGMESGNAVPRIRGHDRHDKAEKVFSEIRHIVKEAEEIVIVGQELHARK